MEMSHFNISLSQPWQPFVVSPLLAPSAVATA
jgi:hypothetical protein